MGSPGFKLQENMCRQGWEEGELGATFPKEQLIEVAETLL